MKKLIFLAMMGIMIFPTTVLADQHYLDEPIPADDEPPVRSLYYVDAWINYETGVFSILANYDITCLYVTIEQNSVVLDSFSQPLYNGVPATYNFANYSPGEYIVTISSPDGMMARYRITVTDD